jgi:cytochrome c biogenesis protein CcdA
VVDAPLAYAFALGMVALVNPCGFAMLPAYLGFFLGLDAEDDRLGRVQALNRAQLVGLSLSLGFLTVFGALGLVFASLYSSIAGWLPWVTMAIGLGLVGLGVAMVGGLQVTVSLPKLERGTGSRQVASMYLFGVSYAVASLSCTIGLFLGAAGVAASGASFASRLASFLSYGAGMGLLATVLTLAMALGRRRVVARFRMLLPRLQVFSGGILLVVGAYVAYYGWWSLHPVDRPLGPVGPVEDLQQVLSNLLSDRAVPLGWLFVAINAALVAWGWAERRRSASTAADQSRRPAAERLSG